MLPAIVIIAEILVVVWFTLFLTMITSTYRDGLSYGKAKTDRASRAFLSQVKYAVLLGMSAVFVLTAVELTGLFSVQSL